MKLKVNLYGSTFKHNVINGKITSTQTKLPEYIEYVEDDTGIVNLFVDRAIYGVKDSLGIRPLCLSKNENSFCLSCLFRAVGVRGQMRGASPFKKSPPLTC